MRLEFVSSQSVTDLTVWLRSLNPLMLGGLALVALPTFTLFLIGHLIFTASSRIIAVRILGTDIYAHVPRPEHDDWLFPLTGDLGYIRRSPPSVGHTTWVKKLNTLVFVYRGLFYSPRLFMADTKAMSHVLGAANFYTYPKPKGTRVVLKDLLGEGVLIAEGEDHKRQRKILQPAFGVAAVRELTPTFFKYSEKLTHKIIDMIDLSAAGPGEKASADGVNHPFAYQSEQSRQVSKPGAPVIDVSFWLNRATLDVIGEAGFSHIFGGLEANVDPNVHDSDSEGDILNRSFKTLFKSTINMSMGRFVQLYLSFYPGLDWIRDLPTQRQRLSRKTYCELEKVSNNIVERKKKEIRQEMQAEADTRGGSKSTFTKADFDEKPNSINALGVSTGKDLLHLMMRANMAGDVSAKEKLSDYELTGQITTLLLAGNETTSTQTSWALKVLADNPEIQQKLREEIHDHFGKGMDREIGYDELMNMRYLDCVAKEMMRFVSPVPNTFRIATSDDVVPLSRPYRTQDGKSTFTSVPIKKGQEIIIPIQVMNFSEEIWGPTADKFDPERWYDENLPASAMQSGLPMHLMTFISGPRGCIGNRFAIAEFKALLCSLLGRLQFERVEGWEIEQKQSIIIRSRVVGQEDEGAQMPLRVSKIKA